MGTSLVLHNVNNTSRITCTRSFNAWDNACSVFWWSIYCYIYVINKMVMFIKTNFSMRKDKASHIDFWKKKSFRYIKATVKFGEDESIPKRVQAITESMVRCKRAYLRVAAVCAGALYLIYIFGMLEKTSRIVRTDAKDLNGTRNTSVPICPMFSPYLSK